MQSRYKQLLSNTVLFSIGNLGTKFILFFLVPLYTSVLNTGEYGIADLVSTSTNLIIPFITLSVNDAILRFALGKDINPAKVIKNTIYVLVGSTLIIVASYPIINIFQPFKNWTIYFIIITALQSIRGAFSIYLKAVDRIKVFTIDSILYTFLVGISSVLLMIVFKTGLLGYFIAQIFSMIVSIGFQLTIGLIYPDTKNEKFDFKLLKEMLCYSTPLIANAVSWWIINSSDRYLLNYFNGTSDVGIYAVAAKMPAVLTTVTSVFSSAWVISSITEYENGRDAKFYSSVFKYYSCFLNIAASAMILIIRPFMKIYVGANFSEAWKFVPYLLIASIYYTFANFFMTLYKSEKKNIREVMATLIGAISNIVINLYLIPYLGIMGACIATFISQILMACFCILDTRRFFKFHINFIGLIFSSVILIIQCVVVTSNFHIYSSSFVCVLLIAIANRKEIINIFNSVFKFSHNKYRKKALLK